jgi:hypothetical protein
MIGNAPDGGIIYLAHARRETVLPETVVRT